MLKNLTSGTVLLVGALSLTAGWLAGTSSSSQQEPDAVAGRARSGPRPLGSPASVAPQTRKLRERLETQPARVQGGGRNPFVFGARRAPVAAQRSDELTGAPPAAAMSAPEPFTPPAPQIKLSGIAASQEGDASVLTAIVNDHGALAFVKTGDRLPSGATVIKVEETGIVIMDAAGITQTIRLP
ncbi:MAG: hypothetical protein Q8O42_21415 [Acidobacteriota bacterium]|nr:hypothetical protein [Acidobacteriota bacterium]